MKLVEIQELEVVLKNEKTSKIKLLHNLLFDSFGDRQNRKRIRDFTGFNLQANTAEFQTKIEHVQKTFSLNDLITLCNLLCINNEGSLIDLSTRLITYLNDLTLLKENILQNDSDSDSEHDFPTNVANVHSDVSRNGSNNLNSSTTEILSSPQFPVPTFVQSGINFTDLENVIVNFDGSIFHNIEKWISNFEEIATVFNLSDIHKFIFAKRSLKGKAKLLIDSESHINTWHKLKTTLLSEFSSVYNSAELHDMLQNRKLGENESLDEYFLIMKQLCARGNIEDSALMQYVINGIPDPVFKKSILYGCETIFEFKQKLKIYEKIRIDFLKSKPQKLKPDFPIKPSRPKTDLRCFNCGQTGHKSIFCRNKDKGPRCFNCLRFGHKSPECTKPKESKPQNGQSRVNAVSSQALTLKDVKIFSLSLTSLVDTGSPRTLLKYSIYNQIRDVVTLESTNITLSGLGNSLVQPIGRFVAEIEIDDSIFKTDVYVLNDTSLSFDLILGTDVIHQGTLIVTGNEVKICKQVNESHNFLVNVINVLDESEIDLNHITDKKLRSELFSLIQNYKPTKTKTVDVQMKINLTDEIPVCSSPRRLPPSEKKIVEAQIEDWLAKGIIQRSSSSYSSPIVLVRKKDNTMRLCVDYRRLNKKTVREHFPLPVIEDIIDELHSANIFTTLDLKNGFFHVDVHEDSRHYTSFVTHEGQYEYLKCPFGLTNSPSVFQKYIYNVFRDLIKNRILVIYMDDLIIPSETETEGIDKLKLVLKTASDYGLELNLKKCQFLKREIEFLGYRIFNGQIHPSKLKTKAVINFPEPKSTKDVQSYLGLTGYFRKFIQNYSIIAKPLSDLLKKDSTFQFGDQQKKAFNELKCILSSEPVLSIYNPKSETQVHCDASIDGYGAVLLQKSLFDNQFHPVYFMSKKTTDAERKYSSYELEVLAIIEALKKFRVYLLGIPFTIISDCKAFALTMHKKDLCTKIARWALMLSDYNYTIEHRHGTSMRHVDALSRHPICMVIQDAITPKIIQAQDTDEHIQTIKEILKMKPYDDYLVKNNVLYKCINGTDLIVVPDEMQINVIKTAHEKGHFSVKRTEQNLKTEFYIPNLKNKIEKCISNCVPCILVNRKHGKQEGLLHPIEKEANPLHTYHIDHLGPLESTHKNYKYIFAVIDAFTKFVWLYPTKSTDAAEVISKLDIQKTVFGNPFRIISDKGTAFTSKAFQDYCDQQHIQHIQVTTGLPRANGQVERLNSIIISVLSKLSVDDPTKWYKHVSNVQQVINSTFQRSINTTPFELLFGTKMKLQTDIKITDLLNAEIQSDFLHNRDELRKEAKKQILKVQNENSKTYNLRRRKAHKFKLNDIVAIKRTQQGPGLKLKSKYLGPYKVTKVKINDTYDVQKLGFTEGPMITSTCAQYMKPWPDEDAFSSAVRVPGDSHMVRLAMCRKLVTRLHTTIIKTKAKI